MSWVLEHAGLFVDSLTPEKVFFLLVAVGTVVCASLTITHDHPVYSAFYLGAAMFGVAVCFVMLDSFFLGVLHLLVHGGASMVLFLYLLQLLDVDLESVQEESYPSMPVILLVALLAGHVWGMIIGESSWAFLLGQGVFPGGGEAAASVVAELRLERVAAVLLEQHWFAFEAVAMLLLASVVGSVVLTKRRMG